MSNKRTKQSLAAIDIERQPLAEFSEKAYLDYSMAVILDRALPHIADGLKPVQRRIIYAMSELGLKSQAKHKKSARTVGDVLGKFHPHGDSACYEAMVLMAQSFSYRYPFVDGQGNWGSIDDPKSFAAMRYTEARLSPYAKVLLTELGKGTVDWVPNFDGTLTEPKLLPAELPNVLLNGGSGIAVGMATDIPPHNLLEVASACTHLLENPKAKLSDIRKFIKGPDYPTKAEIITSPKDITAMYRTGYGTIRQRAVYVSDNGDIAITALPHQVSSSRVMEQIASQILSKKLPMVSDLRDESDHENPVRLVITPKSRRVNIHDLMDHLFATTDLERSYRVNLNMIGIDGRPEVKNLLGLLNEWLSYRLQTLRRRLSFRLEQVVNRLHILAGLLIVFQFLDEVIAIIRKEDQPKPILMKRFKLSDKQVEAILDLKLRQLAKLEEQKIREEHDKLSDEKNMLEKLLASKARLKTLLRQEIKGLVKTYGDKRLSPIVLRREAQAMREQDMLPSEPITVILSKKGWIRSAKGHDIDGTSLNYRAGDAYLMQARGRSNAQVVLLDAEGKGYSLSAHTLPSARGLGDPLTSRLKPTSGIQFVAALMGEDSDVYLIASDAGYGFLVQLEQLYCKSRSGKSVLKCPKGAYALMPQLVRDRESQHLAVMTNVGRLLLFPVADLPELSRGKGNKMIAISPALVAKREEYCVAFAVLNEKSALTVYSGKRHITISAKDLGSFQGERGRRGTLLPRGFRKVDRIMAADN